MTLMLGQVASSGALDVKDYVAAIEKAGFVDVEIAPVAI